MKPATQPWVVLAIISAMTLADSCPSNKCTCTTGNNGVEIDCQYKNLNMVPAFTVTKEKYYKLKLAHNNIQEISSRAFHGLHIEKLDLGSNPIMRISPQAFIGLNNQLTELVLEVNQNEVVDFPPDLLNNQVKLRTLKLKGFTISHLASGLFKNMTNLEKLELEACKISTIQADAFSGIQKSLVELNLRGNKLQTVPKDAVKYLARVEKLVLGQNKIRIIESNVFVPLTNLKDLDLSQNRINHLEIKAFNGLNKSLEFLGLHANVLRETNLVPLSNLSKLEQLNLAYNMLAGTLPDNVFKNMNKLAYINIQGNKLTSISPASFEGLHKELKVLLLSENMFTRLPDEVFHHFEKLQELYLDLMMLGGSLTRHTFHGLADTLQYLTMEGIKFQTRDWDSVKNLKNLETLNLCENAIDAFVPMAFRNMRKLTNLLLSSNIIENITQDDMHGLESSLKQLTLENNKIKTISNCTFHDFTSLRELNLDGNPLHCDCRLLWLKDWMNQLDEKTKRKILWECTTPPRNRDRHFRFVANGDLTCPDPQPRPLLCKDYKITPAPSASNHPKVNISSVSNGPDYLVIRWKLENTDKVSGVRIYYRLSVDVTYSYTLLIHPALKEYKLTGLEPNTNYTVCLGLDLNVAAVQELPSDNCLFLNTTPGLVTKKASHDPNVFPSVIIGSALGGGLLLLLLAIFIGITVCKYKKKKRAHMYCTAQPIPPRIPQPMKVCANPMPHAGPAARRFTRPKSVDSLASGEDVERCIGNINTLLISASNILNLTREGHEGNFTDSALSRDSATGTMSAMNSFHGSALIKGSSRSLSDPLPSPPSSPSTPGINTVAGLLGRRLSDSTSSQDTTKHVYDEIPVLI